MPDTPSTTSGSLCNSLDFGATKFADAPDSVFKSFTKGGALGPFFVEALATLPGSDASEYFNKTRDTLSGCTHWTEPSNETETPTAYTGGELSFAKFGDDTIAFRATSEATFLGSVQIDLALIRRGHALLFIAYAGIGFAPLDVDQFVSFTRNADDKVRSHGID